MIYVFEHAGKSYRVDATDFLLEMQAWDEDFAAGMAERAGIAHGLSEAHWRVIRFIRDRFAAAGECPRAYETCRACGLSLEGLKALFPSGYLRGACKLAGLTYRDGPGQLSGGAPLPAAAAGRAGAAGAGAAAGAAPEGRLADAPEAFLGVEFAGRVDAQGFLLDPADWSEAFAAQSAPRLGLPQGLGQHHWRVLSYLRQRHAATGQVPTVYQTCEANDLTIEQLAALFPSGYHRGAVLLAGLHAR